MKNKIPYTNFKNYVLRTPLMPLNTFLDLTSKKNITEDELKLFCKSSEVKEAIFLASPILYNELEKWLNDDLNDNERKIKLQLSLFKYITRMTSRSTPFGLFAGCSVGEIADETHIELKHFSFNNRKTRLDMDYLINLSKNLINNTKIKSKLKFYPNTTIYEIGEQYRYLEYNNSNINRIHELIAVEKSGYLEKILNKASHGYSINNLAKTIVDKDITIAEAENYILQLIDNQILISELEPAITGEDFLNQIKSILIKIEDTNNTVLIINNIVNKLKEIDKKIGNNIEKYSSLIEQLEKLNTEINPKFLFQTDLVVETDKNKIDKKIIDKVKKCIVFLNALTNFSRNNSLKKFKKSFYERYEDLEVNLSDALDSESGIGYGKKQTTNTSNPLIDGIELQNYNSKMSYKHVKWLDIYYMFQDKILQAYKNNDHIIKLKNTDFQHLKPDWNDIPDTISCMIELFEEKGEEKIRLRMLGVGSSASNLLARFSHCDKKLKKHIENITRIEKKINNDKIIAEIVHLPKSRIGNVIMRPDFHAYEIPYLAKSCKPKEKQIPINDLIISAKNNKKLVLKSKKHNREVIPRLTNAHNFSNDSLPIYHFLSDMQTQNKRRGLGFYLGEVLTNIQFVPRIEYDNIVLQNATWNLKRNHIKELLTNITNTDDIFFNKIKEFKTKFNLPKLVSYINGENKLLINLDNIMSVKILLQAVKKHPSFTLQEFLYDKSPVLCDNNYYKNEIILAFYNEERLKNKSI